MTEETRNVFWRQHLTDVARPLIHCSEFDSLAMDSLEETARELDFALFIIDSQQIRSPSTLMDAFARAMNFPSAFGRNWDALLDFLSDMSWIKAKGYVITFLNAEPLLLLPNSGFSTLLSVLEATIREWRDEHGEYGERAAPIPFHIIFSGNAAIEAALFTELKEPFCDHDASLSVRVIKTPKGMTKIETFDDSKRLIEGGANLELTLSFMREHGTGKIDSAYVLAGLTGESVFEARNIVNKSRTWSHDYETDVGFRNAARDALRDLGFS